MEMLVHAQISNEEQPLASLPSSNDTNSLDDDGVQVNCFSEVVNDVPIHFQIIRLSKQIYAWIGCNSAKFGNLYAAAPTRPNGTVSVSSILGGSSDSIGSGIARRLAPCLRFDDSYPSPNFSYGQIMLEVAAEKMLVQKLVNLGYVRPKSEGPS